MTNGIFMDFTRGMGTDLMVSHGAPRTMLFTWYFGTFLSISGQSFSAPEPTLSFEPKLPGPYNVPFYTSFATWTLQCTFVQKRNQTKMKFQIMSTSGEMFLQQLAVSGFRYPSALTLKQGEVVTWFSH